MVEGELHHLAMTKEGVVVGKVLVLLYSEVVEEKEFQGVGEEMVFQGVMVQMKLLGVVGEGEEP